MWNRRTATIVIGLVDAAVWAFVAVAAFFSDRMRQPRAWTKAPGWS
jgi:hypothetical protein